MSTIQLELKKMDASEFNDEVMSWFRDEDLMRYYTNSKQTITREKILQHIADGEASGTSYTYGIYDTATNKPIGTIKLGPINTTHKISDLVVLIGDRSYHGKGLAIQAIQLGNALAFEHYGLRKLFGGMFASNIQSIKAYLRAGWVVEGIRKAHYLNNGVAEDRIEVACFNPALFTSEEIQEFTYLSLETLLDVLQK